MNKKNLAILLSFIFLMGCAGTTPKLGLMDGQLVPCPQSPNCVSSQITGKERPILPIYFSGTRQEAQVKLLQIIKTTQRTNITDIRDNYIRAEFTSKLFRFIDDVEFYFPATKTDNTIIYFRSASRLGYSDLGANRARIGQIKEKFKQFQ
jgi:uncharacterized protein (DUF1499 family)